MHGSLRRTMLALALLVVPLLAQRSAIAAPAARPARAMTPITLVLKWLPQAQFGGYYVALKKGYYAEEGLDVTIEPGGPDVVPESTVAQGKAQFGTGWLPPLLTARDQGAPLVNIAQIFQTTGMRLIAFKNEHISNPTDFDGKRIGVWFGGNQYQFLAWMNKLKINTGSAFTVVHQGFDMNAFLHHQLDLASAMTYNELGLVLESGVKASDLTIFNYGDEGVSMLEDGLFARSDYLRSHHDIAVRFLRASIHGWQDMVQNPVEAAEIVKTYDTSNVLSLAHQIYMAKEVDKLIDFGPAVEKGIGYMDPVAFDRTARISLQYHVIRKAPVGAFDQSYWREALFGGDVLAYEAESHLNTMTGSAHVAHCSFCSGDAKVRFVGRGSTLQFNVTEPSAGTYTLTIAYTDAKAVRSALMRVNNGPKVHLSFAPTGDWFSVGILQLPIHLKAGANTIQFSNPVDWTPDFDRITIGK